jgi:large subunit ribosomal protein L23
MSKTAILRPRISEKSYGLSQIKNVYVFEVPTDANKLSVAQAVATQFSVTVETVNIMNVKGKVKRTIRRGGRSTMGKRSDIKKAYVTLKEGDSIAVFATDDEANEPKSTAPRQTRTRKEKK